jgi:hypothetical protein
MKRKMVLFALVGAVGVFGCAFAAFAQSSSSKWGKPQTAAAEPCSTATYTFATASSPAKASSAKSNIIEELTAILKETKSPETFLLTTMVLGRMGPDAKSALPAIIRNAERLELLEDLFDTSAPEANRDKNGTRAKFVDAIEMILTVKDSANRPSYPAPAAVYYAPVTSYAPVSPPSYSPAPTSSMSQPSYAPDACSTPTRSSAPASAPKPKTSTSQWRATPSSSN